MNFCYYCSKTFSDSDYAFFCSDDCFDKLKLLPLRLKCEWCNGVVRIIKATNKLICLNDKCSHYKEDNIK